MQFIKSQHSKHISKTLSIRQLLYKSIFQKLNKYLKNQRANFSGV